MERVEDEVISVVGPPMTGDDLRATADTARHDTETTDVYLGRTL